MTYSHRSSPQGGPGSSRASDGTAPTDYSPAVARNGRQQPARNGDAVVQGQLMDVDPAAIWLNELDPTDAATYASRYLSVRIEREHKDQKLLDFIEPFMKTVSYRPTLRLALPHFTTPRHPSSLLPNNFNFSSTVFTSLTLTTVQRILLLGAPLARQ
jgi:hypothetical protein